MAKAKKFGAFGGVFTPSLLTILGVIMYLRLPWIVGQAGLWATLGIILVAHIISFTTGLSVASIATDKKVESGGSYYIISRSLGLSIGGTLGIALFIGLSFSVSLYLIGFAEVFLTYFGFEPTLNNIRIAGAITLAGLTILTFISTALAIKSQYLILTALALSLVSIFFGNPASVPAEPLFDSMPGSLPWIALFAIFFPAVTGFEAGVSMSGDLKDPQRNIPVGTITAIIVGLVVYVGLAVFFSFRVERDLLVNDSSVLFKISWLPQLVIAGILGATLSSALGSILGAPRILQATASDRISPRFLAKGYGPSNEPRNALLFTFVIALSGILIGELNVIARIVTIFFIITYGFLNITYAVESWAGSDFRPKFRIPGIIAIVGALTCIIVMIQLDLAAMLGASVILFGLFLFLKKRELTLQTGDTWNSVWASLVKTGLRKLVATNKLSRNWRPNIILFAGNINQRPHLIEIAKETVGKLGIFTNFDLIANSGDNSNLSKDEMVVEETINEKGKGVFTRRYICNTIFEGVESVASVYGFAGFEPNTIMMGWPRRNTDDSQLQLLIKRLTQLDYNQIFLKYETAFGFGHKKKIDIWWNRKGRNLNFALTLLRFITSTYGWRHAEIRILSVCENEAEAEACYEILEHVLDNSRLKAKIKVINNKAEMQSIDEIMKSESIETDLAIAELENDESRYYSKMNQWLDSLPTTLVIKASGFFEEINAFGALLPQQVKVISDFKNDKPVFDIVGAISIPQTDLIGSEIYQLAITLEKETAQFYNKAINNQLARELSTLEEIRSYSVKYTDGIQKASQTLSSIALEDELLRLRSEYSHQLCQFFKRDEKDSLGLQAKDLAKASIQFIERIDESLASMPRVIKMRYNRKDYKKLKADSVSMALFKFWQLLKTRISGRQAIYNVNITRPAQYLIMHKTLQLIVDLQNGIARHRYHLIGNLNNLLSRTYELAIITAGEKNIDSNSIMSEAATLIAQLNNLIEETEALSNLQGQKLQKNIIDNLQKLSTLLQKPGANFLSRPFRKAINNDKSLKIKIEDFDQVWLSNSLLLNEKSSLDFLTRWIRCQIETRLSRQMHQIRIEITNHVITPATEIKLALEQFPSLPEKELKWERKTNQTYLYSTFNRLLDDLTSVLSDLPGKVVIANRDAGVETINFREEYPTIEISFRRTAEVLLSTELIDPARIEFGKMLQTITSIESQLADHVRLINFNLESDEHNSINDKDTFTEVLQSIEKLTAQSERSVNEMGYALHKGVKNAFSPLALSVIAHTEGIAAKKAASKRNRKIVVAFDQIRKKFSESIEKIIVGLIYSRSEGVLWFKSLDKSGSKEVLSNEEVISWISRYTPSNQVLNKLPYYYTRLFSPHASTGSDFWIGMEDEQKQAAEAVIRHREGYKGCIIITGINQSGKTSLSRQTARKHFGAGNYFMVEPPSTSNPDPNLFDKELLKALKVQAHSADEALATINKPIAIIINDLELWWQRRENGHQVIEKIKLLIGKHHPNVLFIINLPHSALYLIDLLTDIKSRALAVITCSGFDARELRNLILIRHKAGGLQFNFESKHESEISLWDMAGFFNRLFNHSGGNPGLAISLWLSSIEKIEEKVIYMKKNEWHEPLFLSKLSPDQILILNQLIYHSKLRVDDISALLHTMVADLENNISHLLFLGILEEKQPGVLSINAMVRYQTIKFFQDNNLM